MGIVFNEKEDIYVLWKFCSRGTLQVNNLFLITAILILNSIVFLIENILIYNKINLKSFFIKKNYKNVTAIF